MDPLISIIIPTLNRENKIGKAIESIKKQTYSNWEILVIDDGSVDNTEKEVQILAQNDKRIKFRAHSHNKGAQAARNTGIKEAKGQWIAFLDSDDEWLPESLEKRLTYAQKHNLSVVYSLGYIIKEDNSQSIYHIPKMKGKIYKEILAKEGPQFQSLLLTREAIEKIRYLDENIKSYQEWETSIRLAKYFEFGFLEEPTFIYDYRGTDAISRDSLRGGRGYEQIVRKHILVILFLNGPGALAHHYDVIAQWFKEGGDLNSAKRCRFTALLLKCMSLKRIMGKVRFVLRSDQKVTTY